MQVHHLATLRQYAAAISAAISAFIAGNWFGWPSSAVKNILSGKTRMMANTEAVSWAVAIFDVGEIIGPILASYITNWIGRKMTMVILSLMWCITWLLVIFGTNEYYLYATRIIVGICTGFTYTAVPIYLGEIASTKVRGSVGTLFISMMNNGILFELCLGLLVTYETLNIISFPFPILFLLFLTRLPETPYFLIMRGHHTEAQTSLAWLRNLNENSPALKQELEQISENVEEDMKQKGTFKDLISTAGARKATIISAGFAMFERMTGISCILSYSTVTLPPTGGYFSPEVYMIVFGVTLIVGQSICNILIDKIGRKPLLIISCIGCALSTGISALFYWLNESHDIADFNWVAYFSVISFGISFASGIGIIPPIVAVELFPSGLRSYAASTALIFGAAVTFVINKVYLRVLMSFGVHYMFIFFTISTIICIIFTCTMYFETNGKTFSEIQNILKNKC